MNGDDCVRWTIRVALALYAAALVVETLPRRERLAAWLWMTGCVVYLAHVVAAFQFVHHWSHAAAWQATAVATAEATGVPWGGGIFVNYAFSVVWLGDAAWRLTNATGYSRRARWVRVSVQGFMAFIAFQGAVVFAEGAIRWIALAVAAALVVWRLSRPPAV